MSRLSLLSFAPLVLGAVACTTTQHPLVSTPAPEATVIEIVPAVEPEVEAAPAVSEPMDPFEETVEAPAEVIETEEDPALTLGRQFFDEGDWRQARTAFTQALDAQLSFEQEKEVLDLLNEINLKLFSSAGDEGDLTTYKVVAGDTLDKIASANTTTWEMLRRLNGLKNNTIRIGQELKVPKGTLSLRVNKTRFNMDLLINGDFVKRYRVGLGKDGCTPEGEFVIKNRIPHPQDGTYPFGDPKHRLGSHWLGLKGDPQHQGYGIHGCPYEQYGEIGTECSLGCVRVTNEDVEELYEILPPGTKVTISK
ncbi:MAG: L,D-transpeptidase family protein [Planctomycetes bacterium]|nr:L,D-transpeptidase family protein [Planctomycetota bacterium]NUQ35113.1 L,D-transpeptidase family protein [Planctomycetaceae bacterium]